ncbi:MAG: hypothetical protein GY822_14700 [Deltaproteobacteria bacterium]|nr:hypothetical protein [Deltaproteobacteria bacterium]
MRVLLWIFLACALCACPNSNGVADAGDGSRSRDDAIGLPPGEPSVREPDVEPGDGGVFVDFQDGGTSILQDGGSVDGGAAVPQDAGFDDRFGVATLGEACAPTQGTICEADLVCMPIFGLGGVCARPCATAGEDCITGGVCSDLDLDVGLLVCATLEPEGAACDLATLVGCQGEAQCLGDPLEAVCVTPCACAAGEASCAGGCSSGVCVSYNEQGEGNCGTAVPLGGSCSPIPDRTFCEAGICLFEGDPRDGGICWQECTSPGDVICPANTGCMMLSDTLGTCQTTAGREQGALCTTGAVSVGVVLGCAANFSCRDLYEDDAPGWGKCLRSCDITSDCTPYGADCFTGVPLASGATIKACLTLNDLGESCSFPEPYCAGQANNVICVDYASGGTCSQGCTLANCTPGGPSCECFTGQQCLSVLSDPAQGVCGQGAALDEFCDEQNFVFCDDAPGQDVATNALSYCFNNTCRYFCEFPNAVGGVDSRVCPQGMECVVDPIGRVDPSLKICATPTP